MGSAQSPCNNPGPDFDTINLNDPEYVINKYDKLTKLGVIDGRISPQENIFVHEADTVGATGLNDIEGESITTKTKSS